MERRRSPRIEILGRIHGHITALDLQVVVREMSLGGMSLEAPIAFPVGAEHDFRLELGDGSTVRLRGRVVRSTDMPRADGTPGFRIGIQFIDDDPSDGDDALGGLLDKIK